MSTPRRLWIDKTGQPVITTTANGERNARRWGWTPARAVPSDPAPALSAVPEDAPIVTREEVHAITLTPVDVDLEALTAYFDGTADEMVLRVRRNHDPKEGR